MRHRYVRESVTRFAHPGALRGNYANHIFHKRQAVQLATGVMAHIAGAERDKPGCTGEALTHLTALMAELHKAGPLLEVKRGGDVRTGENNDGLDTE